MVSTKAITAFAAGLTCAYVTTAVTLGVMTLWLAKAKPAEEKQQ